MIQRILLLTSIFCVCFGVIQAQVPVTPNISYVDVLPGTNPGLRTCASTVWSAGTSTQALAPSAQSNDVQFLCANDVLNITHNGDYNLNPSEDPNTTTPAGITYVFYNCSPTATGPDVTNINSDPCIVPNPNPPIPFYLVGPTNMNAAGTGQFTNNGNLQTAFSSGNPLQLYFAPVTIHNFAGLAFESANNTSDICLNVNASDAFSVVYLNAITQSNVNNNAGSPCTGSFDIAGGLPQYTALSGSTSNYTISIVKSDNAAVLGTVTSGAATQGSTVTFSVPEAGTYNVSVEDGKSCGATFSVDMTACVTTTMSATYTITNPTCTGTNNGQITVGISNGTAPYTINWQLQPSGTLETTSTSNPAETISNLAPGTYGITVTDSGNNTDNSSVTLTDPPAIGASLINLTQPTCNGLSDGSMEAQISSGGVVITPDNTYTFQWSGTTQATNVINNLVSGPYAVTVTNAAGCTATAATTLSQPAAVAAPPITGNDVACVGKTNGSATINPTGGTGSSYSYAWNTSPQQTTATATNLPMGIHIVTVTDQSNCTYIDSVTIGAATVLTANTVSTDITCNGANNGQINVQQSVQGVDNGNYSYAWTDNVSTSDHALGLSAQTYTITVTDGAQCTAIAQATISEPSPINVIASATDETCTVGNDGTISTTVTGGTPLAGGNYNYTWSNNAVTANLTGLSGNTYTVTVTDARNCTVTTSATVNVPGGPAITGFSTTNVSCATSTNGSITVNVNAGSTAITSYAWSAGGSTTATNDNLAAGSYTVTITDAGGCSITGSTSLSAPPALVQTGTPVVTTPHCPGGGEGTIAVVVSGGVPPYSYAWPNGSSGPAFDTATNLLAGDYVATVTDANGCTLVLDTITVSDPPAITATFQNLSPVSCFNGTPCDGEATITASGGLSSNYTFTWASGETSSGGSATAIRLCQGNQNVTITDGFCTVAIEMGADSILAPQPVTVGELQTTDATCNGNKNGSATITPTGGAGLPYNIAWNNGQGGVTATNLSPSLVYTLTITDSKGCRSDPFTVTINEPDVLVVKLVDTIDITCNGDKNGRIQVAPQGGNTGNFTYQWFPNTTDTTNVISNLSRGNYAVTVTDEKGCTATAVADVDEPAALQFDYTQPKQPNCSGNSTVFALDTVYGGSGLNYTYTLDSFNYLSTNQAASVYAGTYTIQVFDSLDCKATETVVITEPEPIKVNLGADTIIGLGDSIELVPSILPLGIWDSLVWTPATGLSCTDCFNPMASPRNDITYTLTVYDERGCFASDSKLVDVKPNRNVFIPNIFTPNEDGKNDFFAPQIGAGVASVDKFIIFDRWGELVYSATNFVPDPTGNNGWNGAFKSKRALSGVYVYIIEVTFVDGEKLMYKGDVTLLK